MCSLTKDQEHEVHWIFFGWIGKNSKKLISSFLFFFTVQKYRLHNRRPGTAAQSTSSTLAPQIVLVNGILVPPPPPEFAVARLSSDLISPEQKQAEQVLPRPCSRDDESGDDEVTNSESMIASATSQTRIASPSFWDINRFCTVIFLVVVSVVTVV